MKEDYVGKCSVLYLCMICKIFLSSCELSTGIVPILLELKQKENLMIVFCPLNNCEHKQLPHIDYKKKIIGRL